MAQRKPNKQNTDCVLLAKSYRSDTAVGEYMFYAQRRSVVNCSYEYSEYLVEIKAPLVDRMVILYRLVP